jgi:hypothetical protein
VTSNPDRVQGIDSSLNDLVLQDGRRVHIAIGGAVVPTPTHKRTIAGGSSIELTLRDHALGFLDAALLAQKWDAELDGLHYRYIGADLQPNAVGLTLKDRDIAVLEEQAEPVSAFRKDMTRAEFIVARVLQVRPDAKIVCPQLHQVQPIETEKQGTKAAEDAKASRGKGIGATKGLTVKGVKATPEQIEIGERAARTMASHKTPFRVAVANFAGLIVESGLGAFTKNYMEMTPETAAASKYSPTVIEEAVTGFLLGYVPGQEGAIAYFKSHPDAEPFQITQAVQGSGAGAGSDGQANYGPWVAEARAWVEAFEGGEFSAEGASRTVTEPYTFELCGEQEGKKEDANWWEGIKRLAKQVNWRAFWVAGTFFYIDEIELFRGAVRLAIDRETPGIQTITGQWRANRAATGIQIEAFASEWKVPPGAVVTVEGYGPFSLGFGDAPLKKGQVGLSNNRAAGTGVGRARYLLETIEAPLRDSDTSELKLVKIALRKPTAPLPEPTAAKKTLSSGSGSLAAGGGGNSPLTPAGAPPEIDAMLTEMEALVGTPYKWGGGHDSVATRESEYDCSGAMSRVLHVAGLLDEPLTSGTLAGKFEPGKGKWFVMYANSVHVWCEILTTEGWKEWEEGGTVDTHAGFLPGGTQSPSGYSARHPRGL